MSGVCFHVFGFIAFFDLISHHTQIAQTVSIHHMIDLALTVAQLKLSKPWRNITLHKTHIPCIAVKFATVHHTIRISRFAAATLIGSCQQRIFCRGEAKL